MNQERRRYFRIDDTVSMRLCNASEQRMLSADTTSFINEHDTEIDDLVRTLADKDPATARILYLLNQKIERLADVQSLENRVVSQVAMRVQEVNISACGMAFQHDQELTEGSQVSIELELRPSEQTLITDAIVVGCEKTRDKKMPYFCRVDFYGMSPHDQELLIQQIVKAQSAQLMSRRNR